MKDCNEITDGEVIVIDGKMVRGSYKSRRLVSNQYGEFVFDRTRGLPWTTEGG